MAETIQATVKLLKKQHDILQGLLIEHPELTLSALLALALVPLCLKYAKAAKRVQTNDGPALAPV